MAKVFISYASAERRWAAWLDERLARNGHTIWWDRDLIAGTQFASTIRNELETSDVVIVLWSEASWNSQWVQAEALAAHESKKLLSVRIGGLRLGVPFNATQVIDLDLDVEAERSVERILCGIERFESKSDDLESSALWIDQQFEDLPRATAISALTSKPELLRNGAWERSKSKILLEQQALKEHDSMAMVWLADVLWARAMPNDRFRARTIVANIADRESGMAGDFASERVTKWH